MKESGQLLSRADLGSYSWAKRMRTLVPDRPRQQVMRNSWIQRTYNYDKLFWEISELEQFLYCRQISVVERTEAILKVETVFDDPMTGGTCASDPKDPNTVPRCNYVLEAAECYRQRSNISTEQEDYLVLKCFKDLKDSRNLCFWSERSKDRSNQSATLASVQMLREGSSHISRLFEETCLRFFIIPNHYLR